MKIDKRKLDVVQVFLVYVATVGDVERTAAALDLDPEVVRQLAHDEQWALKLQRACPGRPQDSPLLHNRALNFIQAHRLRMLLDGLIRAFDGLEPEEILSRLMTVTNTGKTTLSGRFMADLSAALEKAHHLSYAALGDTPAERATKANEVEGVLDAAALHTAVIRALADEASPVPADELVKSLAVEVERNAIEPPQPPVVEAEPVPSDASA